MKMELNNSHTVMNSHKLAAILLSMPDLPVRFEDPEGNECEVLGTVQDIDRPSYFDRLTVLLSIQPIPSLPVRAWEHR